MARLPARDSEIDVRYPKLFSIAVSDEQHSLLQEEMKRTGIKSRSELLRQIIDDYFSQEV